MSPAMQCLLDDALETAGSIIEQAADQPALALVASGITTGVELGLALALAHPETARHLLAAIDGEVLQGDERAISDERRAYLARYVEAIR